MTLLACWVLFPVVLGTVALGCGLLVESATGTRIQGMLLAPVGLALVILIASIATLAWSVAAQAQTTAKPYAVAISPVSKIALCSSVIWCSADAVEWSRA